MAKYFETVFEIAGKVAGSFDKSLLDAGKNLQRLQKQISALSPVDANIAKFRQLKTQLNATETEYQQLGDQIAQMAKQMHSSGPPTKKMAQEFEIAKLRAAQLKQTIGSQRIELQQLRTSLSSAGVSTRNLAQDQIRLQQQTQKLIALQQKLKSTQDAITANMNKRADLRGQMFDAVAIGAAASAPIVQAAQFEKAMSGVAKQVSGARDESGQLTQVYHDMAKQIQQLGREIPLATNDIADMVAAGARMGVAKDELIGFTKTAAMMAAAFELPAGELADQMGKIAGLYKIPIANINELADTINYLDDNAIAKGGDIISFLQRTGGVAGSVKITSKEMAALGSTLLTMGETTETAGTAVNTMMAKFAAADKGTKAFKSALDQVGLSAEDIQSGMATDAVGTFQKIAEAIKQLPEDQRVGVMVDLVGMEHQDTLGKLVNGLDEFRKQLEMANSEAAKGSMGREFQANLALTTSQWQIMKNVVTEVSVALGTALLPALNGFFKVIAPVAGAVADFARENQTLVSIVGGLAVGLVALKVSALAVGYAWTFVTGGALMLNSALLAVRAAYALSTGAMVAGEIVSKRVLVLSKMMTAAQWLWNAALAANPIGLVITAVAALVAAGVLLYQNWAEIKEGAAALWTSMQQVWTDIKAWWDSIDLTDVGIKMLETIGNGILQAGPKLVEKMKGVLSSVRDYLPFSDAKIGPLSELTASGRAIVSTLGDGVNQGAGTLTGAMNGALKQDLSTTGISPAGVGGGGSFTYAPTIQVTGQNADQIRVGVTSALQQDRGSLEEQFKKMMNNEARLSFA